MRSMVVYDKVSWHYPEGKKCPSIEAAKSHFVKIMGWLAVNNFLSEEGNEILALEIDSDFSLTSDMLTDKGNEIIKKSYSEWLKTIDYNIDGDTKYLDLALTRS